MSIQATQKTSPAAGSVWSWVLVASVRGAHAAHSVRGYVSAMRRQRTLTVPQPQFLALIIQAKSNICYLCLLQLKYFSGKFRQLQVLTTPQTVTLIQAVAFQTVIATVVNLHLICKYHIFILILRLYLKNLVFNVTLK